MARGDYDWLTPDLEVIYRDFEPVHLRPLLDAAGIDGTILVQAAPSVAETGFLLSLADTQDWVLGVVGWVDLETTDAPETLARLAQGGKLVGVRPMIHDIPDDQWMLRPALQPAIECLIELDLTFDALVRPNHLDPLMCFFGRYPDLKCVIDHGAKPPIHSGALEPWASQMTELAGSTGAFCKLSGLLTEASSAWSPAEIQPYAELLIEQFGPSRLMFGSDWPVVTLAAGYGDWIALARQLTQHLSERERAQIFGETAARFYLEPR